MENYHIQNDLGINKATLKNIFKNETSHLYDQEITERGWDIVEELLNRRTQTYSKSECYSLVGSYITSHDECVLGNPDDFSGVELYNAEQKWDRAEAATMTLDSDEDELMPHPSGYMQ